VILEAIQIQLTDTPLLAAIVEHMLICNFKKHLFNNLIRNIFQNLTFEISSFLNYKHA